MVLGGAVCSVSLSGAAYMGGLICKNASTCPSTDEWINTVWSIHLMEYYLAMKSMKFWHMQQCG